VKLPHPLIQGRLIKRYKRFLADVELPDGRVVTAHCPNSGSMRNLIDNHPKVYLSQSDNPKRKLPYTLELIRRGEHMVVAHSVKANAIVQEAITQGRIPELTGYTHLRSEVPYGTGSRIDLLLEYPKQKCYVEVKSVTLLETPEMLQFPDAVTTRGQKHLEELMQVVRSGDRGVIFFAALHTGGVRFSPADGIDPKYGKLLREAVRCGVEAYCYQAAVTTESVELVRPIPIEL